MSVAKETNMADTRLAPIDTASSPRVDTGTPAIMGRSGVARWASNQRRTAVAVRDSTTSLTVVPRASLTARTSSSDTRLKATWRWAVIGALNGVVGAVNGVAIEGASARLRRTARLTTLRVVP